MRVGGHRDDHLCCRLPHQHICHQRDQPIESNRSAVYVDSCRSSVCALSSDRVVRACFPGVSAMDLRSGSKVGAGILRSAHRPQFEEGVNLVLKKWTALQLAVENQWGGRDSTEKADDMYNEILEWFYKRKEHYPDELEPLLETIILEDFNVQAEDGSPLQVSKALVDLYKQCLAGDFSLIQRLSAVASGAQQSAGFAVDNDGTAVPMNTADGGDSSDDDADDDDEMDVDEAGPGAAAAQEETAQRQQAPAGPVIDDDGFQMVQRGRRRR
eukprot:jgi/Ulvmu1/9476/UM052_0045.1